MTTQAPSQPVQEIHPHVLYRRDGHEARFATWRLAEGHETLALFTSPEAANQYRQELSEPAQWLAYQPPRDKLQDILHACRSAGILYASLDPASGSAKTLFDIQRVITSALTSPTAN
jgi:hypothetical protein